MSDEVSATPEAGSSSAEAERPARSSGSMDDKAIKAHRTGVCYLETIPLNMSASRIRETFQPYGKGKFPISATAKVNRIYLAPDKHKTASGHRVRKYAEGWVEFADKRVAKRVAASFNNTPVGGKRRSASAECLWVIKYLNRFKWMHLQEQLDFERAVHKQRLQAEVSQARRQANFFAQQVEKGAKLAALEEQVLRKGGRWEQYKRQLNQKKPVQPKQDNDNEMLEMIFQ